MNIPTFAQRSIPIEECAVHLRSNIWRTASRAARGKNDATIAGRWLLRWLRREGGLPVDAPEVSYTPDAIGPRAIWRVKVRAVRPRTDYERERFANMVVPRHWRDIRYVERAEPSLRDLA